MVLKTIDLALVILCVTNALRYLRDFFQGLLLIWLKGRWLDNSSELFGHKFLASGDSLLIIYFSCDILLNIFLNRLLLNLYLRHFLSWVMKLLVMVGLEGDLDGVSLFKSEWVKRFELWLILFSDILIFCTFFLFLNDLAIHAFDQEMRAAVVAGELVLEFLHAQAVLTLDHWSVSKEALVFDWLIDRSHCLWDHIGWSLDVGIFLINSFNCGTRLNVYYAVGPGEC